MQTRCYEHWRDREREKLARRSERKKVVKVKKPTKKQEKSERKKLHAKAWRLMSEYIRSKDADYRGYVACFTCDTIKHWKEMQCGHYQHGKLDFDERNLKPQCVKCNMFLSGNLANYTMNLIAIHGIEWVRQLRNDASKHAGYGIDELRAIIAKLST